MPYVPREIDERAFRFFCGIIRLVRTIEYEPEIRRLADRAQCQTLLEESRQLARILAAIVLSAKRK